LATQIELSLTGCEGAVESNPQPLLTLEFESQPSIETLGLSLANGKAEHAAAGDDGDDRDVARQDQALAEGARSPSSAECHSADTYGRVVRVDLDTEAKSLGELKDDKSVGSRFSCRFRNGLAKLDEVCSCLTALEACAQSLPFPRRVDRQKYVGQRCRRSHHDVAMDEKFQIGQCPGAAFAVCMVDQKIAPEINESTDWVWVAMQDCIIKSI